MDMKDGVTPELRKRLARQKEKAEPGPSAFVAATPEDSIEYDEEDRAAISEAASKGYYHGRPPSEATASPPRLEEGVSQPQVRKRTEIDDHQRKWDRFGNDKVIQSLETGSHEEPDDVDDGSDSEVMSVDDNGRQKPTSLPRSQASPKPAPLPSVSPARPKPAAPPIVADQKPKPYAAKPKLFAPAAGPPKGMTATGGLKSGAARFGLAGMKKFAAPAAIPPAAAAYQPPSGGPPGIELKSSPTPARGRRASTRASRRGAGAAALGSLNLCADYAGGPVARGAGTDDCGGCWAGACFGGAEHRGAPASPRLQSSLLHALVHPGCSSGRSDGSGFAAPVGSGGSQEHGVNLNLGAAFLHLVADVLRSITILVVAVVIQVGGVQQPGKADAICALLVSVLILLGAAPMARHCCASAADGSSLDGGGNAGDTA